MKRSTVVVLSIAPNAISQRCYWNPGYHSKERIAKTVAAPSEVFLAKMRSRNHAKSRACREIVDATGAAR